MCNNPRRLIIYVNGMRIEVGDAFDEMAKAWGLTRGKRARFVCESQIMSYVHVACASLS